jgi:hypothetical protein
VSIEPIGSIDSNTTPLIELVQVFQMGATERQPVPHDPTGIAALTAGDRDLLTALYGPEVLTPTSILETPQFMVDVIADRMSGRLPEGTELTSTYVQARFDAYADLNGTVRNPLTEQNLLDARIFFFDRVQGAAIDLKA